MDLIVETLLIFVLANIVSCKEIAVKTPVGTIYGVSDMKTRAGQKHEFSYFLGIPYAEPPIGIRRFEKPERKSAFKKPFYANNSRRIACPSNEVYPDNAEFEFQEDCLLLNIFVPGNMKVRTLFPVMVYIHGGGFMVGSHSSFRAPFFAARSGAILVTFNYRLGPLGFLAYKKAGLNGNYGLWDQHMAIKWVHDNIRTFGGDTNHVTLFGNSAGSASVIYQALYPGNRNLFDSVIAESGSPTEFWAHNKNPKIVFDKLTDKLNCTGDLAGIVHCMRGIPIDVFVKRNDWLGLFIPTLDDEFVTRYIDELFMNHQDNKEHEALKMFGDINVITGMNSNDGGLGIKLISDLETFNRYDFIKLTRSSTVLGRDMKPLDLDLIYERVVDEYIGHLNESNDSMLKQGFLNLTMDKFFTVSMTLTANVHANLQGAGNTYFYVFDHRPSFSNMPSWAMGANHADELPFVFWFPDYIMHDFFEVNSNDPTEYLPQEEFQLADSIMSYWIQFAKTGDPNPENSTKHWPTYNANTQEYLKFNVNEDPFPIGRSFRRDKVKFWLEDIQEMFKFPEKSSSALILVPQYLWLLIVSVFPNIRLIIYDN